MKWQQVAQWVNDLLQQYTGLVTVRQLFYRLVSPPYQVIANTLSAYHNFDSHLVHARELGVVNWRRIADPTRRIISVSTWDSPDDFKRSIFNTLSGCHNQFHFNKWKNQEYALKVLVEKEALAEVVNSVAEDYYVDVAPIRGYGSTTQKMTLSMDSILPLVQEGKNIVILYLGDFDPTGLNIDTNVEDKLSAYSGASLDFKRIALTRSDTTNLAPNPVKVTDTRAPAYVAKYGNNCWELDALPPNQLQDRIKGAIEAHIDIAQWNKDTAEEKEARIQIQLDIEKLIKGGV